MRRLLVALLAVVGLAALAANAAIAIPTDGDGYQTMSPFKCPDFGKTQPDFDSASPIRIKYAWGATGQGLLGQFLRHQSGSVTVSGGSTPVPPDVWNLGDQTGWSAAFPQTLLDPGGNPLTGVATKKYTVFGTLAPGSYTLNVSLRIDQKVSDGPGSSVPAGAWLTVTNCPFRVQ